MAKSKFFKFSFPNGDPKGIAKCAYDKVAIVSYRIPRDRIKDIRTLDGSSYDDLQNPGVYMLIGKPIANKIPFYVGQAAPRRCGNPIYNRLSEHDRTERRTKEWWTTAFVFIDATNSRRVDETGLKYLENALYVSAKNNSSLDVRNGNEPPGGSPDESALSVLDDIYEGINLCAKVFGFSGEVEISQETTIEGRSFHGRTTYGEANLIWDGRGQYTLLAGSKIRIERESSTLSRGDVEFRRANAGLFMPDGKLRQNIVFKSSSAAAKFVCGFPVAGPTFWKNENGIKMKEVVAS
jgi:hypothetical protein